MKAAATVVCMYADDVRLNLEGHHWGKNLLSTIKYQKFIKTQRKTQTRF